MMSDFDWFNASVVDAIRSAWINIGDALELCLLCDNDASAEFSLDLAAMCLDDARDLFMRAEVNRAF